MIWTWIYLTYVLVFISGTTAEGVGVGMGMGITIQILDDFTFVLVHNLSEIKDWDNFFNQLPYLQSQLMFGQQTQVDGQGGGGSPDVTGVVQIPNLGQMQILPTNTNSFQGSPVQKPTVDQVQKPPQTEKPEPVQNPDQTPPTPVDNENPDQEQVTQKPVPMKPTIPQKPAPIQQPIPPKPVPMQQPIPPKPVPMQQPIPPKPVPTQGLIPPKPVSTQQPIPPKPVPTQQPIPIKPVLTQQPMQPEPNPMEQVISSKPVPMQQPIPQKPSQQQIPQKPSSISQQVPQKPSYSQQSQQKPFTVRPLVPQKPGSGQPQIPQKPATVQQPTIPQNPGGGGSYQQKIPPETPEPEVETTTPIAPMEKPNQQAVFDSDSCGMRGAASPSRIVGGANAQPAEFPWQLSLQLMSGPRARHICGAAVLSAHWAITAAHCIWEIKPEQLSVVAGDHDLYIAEGPEQRVNVARIVVNKYKRETFTNDVAMLQLVTPLNVDYKYITPICLPGATQRFLRGDSVVTGWGRLSENGALPHVLQHVSLPILSLKRCHSFYRKAGYTKFIHTCQLCSGFELGAYDSCQGDSGGPLACKQSDGRYYLCGIVSWGVGCARPKFPGVYTEVTCYVEWIKHIINNDGNVLNKAPSIVSIPSNTRSWRVKTTTKVNGKPYLEVEEDLGEEEEKDEESGRIYRRRIVS